MFVLIKHNALHHKKQKYLTELDANCIKYKTFLYIEAFMNFISKQI